MKTQIVSYVTRSVYLDITVHTLHSIYLLYAHFLNIETYTESPLQDRLYKEITSVVGLEDDVPIEDLNRMPYLEQVIKESLRWFLIVPYTLRKASKDVPLSMSSQELY